MTMRAAATALLFASAACTGGEAAREARVETLPNGATLRVYAERPDGELWMIREAVRIGSADGPLEEAFGDVRGLERDSDGSILVLDYQPDEVRRFSPAGDYLETIARSGDGPGEIGDSNGLFIGADGMLWINDHDHWSVTGLRPDGSVTSVRMPTLSYGYLWEGKVTDDGWTWDTNTESLDGPRGPSDQPEPGLVTYSFVVFLNGTNVDQSEAGAIMDSVEIGRYTSSSVFLERGWAGVPHAPRFLTAIDPAGFVWTAWGGEYRLTKTAIRGDTIAVVEMPASPAPVTAGQRQEAIDNLESFMERVGRVIPLDYDEIIPAHHPVMDQLVIDDSGRLWVGRQGENGRSVYDVFSPNGEFLANATSDIPFLRYFIPVVRGTDFLTIVRDELDVQYVVRGEIVTDPG
jgi:hypothetical protein